LRLFPQCYLHHAIRLRGEPPEVCLPAVLLLLCCNTVVTLLSLCWNHAATLLSCPYNIFSYY
jgi:hypothetical protein